MCALKLTPLERLRRNPENWFPEDALNQLNRIDKVMGTASPERSQEVHELKRLGYEVPLTGEEWEKESIEKYGFDHFILYAYYRELLEALWPQELSESLRRKAEEITHLDAENFIRFLEINPYFFRTGYAKQRAIQKLLNFPLTPKQQARLAVVLEQVVSAWRISMTDWVRLARAIPLEQSWVIALKYANFNGPPKYRAQQLLREIKKIELGQ